MTNSLTNIYTFCLYVIKIHTCYFHTYIHHKPNPWVLPWEWRKNSTALRMAELRLRMAQEWSKKNRVVVFLQPLLHSYSYLHTFSNSPKMQLLHPNRMSQCLERLDRTGGFLSVWPRTVSWRACLSVWQGVCLCVSFYVCVILCVCIRITRWCRGHVSEEIFGEAFLFQEFPSSNWSQVRIPLELWLPEDLRVSC